jgi:tRNA dimethylallyltransferase
MATALVIIGPTASGKTALAEHLASTVPGEIINADMGQLYEPLTIGTAKPLWRSKPFACHLFDMLTTPTEFNASAFRTAVIDCVDLCSARHTKPVIVGGSLFYVKSLFFPPHSIKQIEPSSPIDTTTDAATLWRMLNDIDPDRAQAIHPNDRYRLTRALTLWHTTGQKPSTLNPHFIAPFDACIIALEPPEHELKERIAQRAAHMINEEGWIQEAEHLMHTQWESFIIQKGLIGYAEIFAWIRAGKPAQLRSDLIATITTQTWQYAKRQLKFLHKFYRDVQPHTGAHLSLQVIPLMGDEAIQMYIAKQLPID